ncbi:V-type ATP synthase subunit A [Geomesophilobacter sediminis]|uniref:V-type ATP synthase subunit A n=1 Tax=Geomesophilobacter sediminis TaxID=2798584 RepID=A0A8J7M0H2_9BACT|nr:V-type ATP synthase subunit A [Geomesophilobacter sediminis]MBJ6725172.1 V-type ATP synthase subunit A [Geomesophilobacter sediminis]
MRESGAKGTITGISGPTVTVDTPGLKLCEMVLVGAAQLAGEVVRLERERTVVQVYEETRGLSVGEPARGTGLPLTVRLGPGLISTMYDGLQRPLESLRQVEGPFLRSGRLLEPLDPQRNWQFTPVRHRGEAVRKGELIGTVAEGALLHEVVAPREGTLESVIDGTFTIERAVAAYPGGEEIFAFQSWPVRRPRPYRRKFSPAQPLVTGQRAIDFLFPIARGGTAIFPGGFGTGKTILEQSIAKYADADLVVYVGCGERGNEMAELLEEFRTMGDRWTGRGLLERTVVVVNTSNMPVAAREASIYTAVAMAEYFRDQGKNVLLLADSISRWGEALREISSTLEEMPGEEGYPTYLASRLAAFMERAGTVETLSGKTGSLSMILSVSPPGGDFTEPVTQACLRTAGVFLMLDTALAHGRHFPAINWFQSYSLYRDRIARHYEESVPGWEAMAARCRELLQKEEALREVAEIVGAEGLQDADRLLMHTAERIRTRFLRQNAYSEDAFSAPEQTAERIAALLEAHEQAQQRLAEGVLLEDLL